MDTQKIHDKFTEIRFKAAHEWGAFRRLISANPLTGFWIGVTVGAGIGAFVVWVL